MSDLPTAPPSHSLSTLLVHGSTAEQNTGVRNPALLYLMSLGSRKSQATIKSIIQSVAVMVGAQDMYDVQWSLMTRGHVLTLLEALRRKGRSESYCNLFLATLKGVAREAWNAGQIDSERYHRIQGVRTAKIKRKSRGRLISGEEIARMIEAALEHPGPAGARDAAIVAILRGCGPRRSELASLALDKYNPDERSISVIGKGNQERFLYLPDEAHRLTDQWLAVRGDQPGALFLRIDRWGNIKRSGITAGGVAYIVERLAMKAGLLTQTTPHDYRKTFVTELLNEGEDISVVSGMAGHADVKTTMIYDLSTERRMRKSARKIDIYKTDREDS